MFYYLSGTVAAMEANLAVLDCGGVGFAVRTTTVTQSRLRAGQAAKLYTYCSIREDAFDIYGFYTPEEKRCFELLLGVNGVGPKAALGILSSVTADGLTMAVLTQDEKALTNAPGVGKKLAQRIIMELKDKLGDGVSADFSGGPAPVAVSGGKVSEATAALSVLGYSQGEIGAAMKGLDAESLTVEELVKQALRNMIAK